MADLKGDARPADTLSVTTLTSDHDASAPAPLPPPPVILLDGVTKSFGANRALDDLHLSVPGGRITVLLGPNGAGKTTAIRTITGAFAPDAGRVRVFGLDPAVDGDEVCGTVAMRRSTLTRPTDALVQRLYVRPVHRRRGIAAQLMTAVQAQAAAAAFGRVVLNVMTAREGARAFYERLGYAPLTDPVDWPYGGIWLCYTVPAS